MGKDSVRRCSGGASGQRLRPRYWWRQRGFIGLPPRRRRSRRRARPRAL